MTNEKLYLIKYDEIGIKGRNRFMFENRLIKNLRRRLKQSDIKGTVNKIRGRILLTCTANAEKLIKTTPGVAAFARAFSLPKKKDFFNTHKKQFKKLLDTARVDPDNFTFKINARRHDKSFIQTSNEINNDIGAKILNNYAGAGVDLHKPDITIYIEVRDNIYIYGNYIRCYSGLPVGSLGRSVVLLSGGIDSPVAAVKMSIRGVSLYGIHFHSYPYTSIQAQEKVIALAAKIKQFCPGFTLAMVDFSKLQKKIRASVRSRYYTVIMRRIMLKIAAGYAKQFKITSLTTGESLGQVSSQTMESMNATDKAADMIIFRPLLGCNKNEIINLAKEYDTYQISIQPYEDCCTIFNPPNPATRPDIAKITANENKIVNLQADIQDCIDNIKKISI